MNENEMLNELEKLELELIDTKDLVKDIFLSINLIGIKITNFKQKIEREQNKMGEALSKKEVK